MFVLIRNRSAVSRKKIILAQPADQRLCFSNDFPGRLPTRRIRSVFIFNKTTYARPATRDAQKWTRPKSKTCWCVHRSIRQRDAHVQVQQSLCHVYEPHANWMQHKRILYNIIIAIKEQKLRQFSRAHALSRRRRRCPTVVGPYRIT